MLHGALFRPSCLLMFLLLPFWLHTIVLQTTGLCKAIHWCAAHRMGLLHLKLLLFLTTIQRVTVWLNSAVTCVLLLNTMQGVTAWLIPAVTWLLLVVAIIRSVIMWLYSAVMLALLHLLLYIQVASFLKITAEGLPLSYAVIQKARPLKLPLKLLPSPRG